MTTPVFSGGQTTGKAVAAHLRAEIQQGLLAPGSRLRQVEVADRLGVSTTPVREALQLLQAEGLVQANPHRTPTVFRPSLEEIREAFEIREALETLALAKAVENVTPNLLDELEQILEEMDAVEDGTRWLDLNNEFHMKMYDASRRPRLCSMLKNINATSNGYLHMVVIDAKESGRAHAEHRAILAGLRQRNGEEAVKALANHLLHTVEHVISYLEEAGSLHNSDT